MEELWKPRRSRRQNHRGARNYKLYKLATHAIYSHKDSNDVEVLQEKQLTGGNSPHRLITEEGMQDCDLKVNDKILHRVAKDNVTVLHKRNDGGDCVTAVSDDVMTDVASQCILAPKPVKSRKRKPITVKLWHPRHITRNYMQLSELDICLGVYMDTIKTLTKQENCKMIRRAMNIHRKTTRRTLLNSICSANVIMNNMES